VQESAAGSDVVVSSVDFSALIQELGLASDSLLARLLWELINDSQSVTWQNINNSDGTTWTVIDTSETTNWQTIQTLN
jgi:hypothetical protein